MSRRLPTAALLAALVVTCLAGCGPSAATTGKGGPPASHAGPSPVGTSKDSAKTTAPHHEPG
jgi:hypothetical protein